jgi:protein farnesyltransferase subunit beta
VDGGLRDKPSKMRDYYHSCYNLSGLSVSQHTLSEDGKPVVYVTDSNA